MSSFAEDTMSDPTPVKADRFYYVVDDIDMRSELFNGFPSNEIPESIINSEEYFAKELREQYPDMFDHIKQRIAEGKKLEKRAPYSDDELEQLTLRQLTEEECDGWLKDGIISETTMYTFPVILQQWIECLNVRTDESKRPNVSDKAKHFAFSLAMAIDSIHDFPSLTEARNTVRRILTNMMEYEDNGDEISSALRDIDNLFRKSRMYEPTDITMSQHVCRSLIRDVHTLLGVKLDSDILNIAKFYSDIKRETEDEIDLLKIMKGIKEGTALPPISPADKVIVSSYLEKHHRILGALCDEMEQCKQSAWDLVMVDDAGKKRPLFAILYIMGITDLRTGQPKLFPYDARGSHLRDPMAAAIADDTVLEIETRIEPNKQIPDLSTLLVVYFENRRVGYLPIQPSIFGYTVQCDYLRVTFVYAPVDFVKDVLGIDDSALDVLHTAFIKKFIEVERLDKQGIDLLKSIRFVEYDGKKLLPLTIAKYKEKLSVDGVCDAIGKDAVRSSEAICIDSISGRYRPPDSLIDYYKTFSHENSNTDKGKKRSIAVARKADIDALSNEITISDKQSGDRGFLTKALLLSIVSRALEMMEMRSKASVLVTTGDLAYTPDPYVTLCMTSTTSIELLKHDVPIGKTIVGDKELVDTMVKICETTVQDIRDQYFELKKNGLLTRSQEVFCALFETYGDVKIDKWFMSVYNKQMLNSVNQRSLDRSILFKIPPALDDFCNLLTPQLIELEDLLRLIQTQNSYVLTGNAQTDTNIVREYIKSEIQKYVSTCSITGIEYLAYAINETPESTFTAHLATYGIITTGRATGRASGGLKEGLARVVNKILEDRIAQMLTGLKSINRSINGGGVVENKRRHTRKHIRSHRTRYSRKKIKMTHKKHTKSDKRGTRKKNRLLYPSMPKSGT